jgi:hypothetical protein
VNAGIALPEKTVCTGKQRACGAHCLLPAERMCCDDILPGRFVLPNETCGVDPALCP